METVVSGIRPTGNLHLGNYFGAVQNFVKMQQDHDSYFFVADYHSLTTHPTPENLHANVRSVLSQYIAAGLDPEKACIYVQSDVPETAELYLYLNMNAYLGELQKVTSFKDKVRANPENVNAGLLTYPTLMAADVIIHKATKVPVGKDQEQNLEMMRTFARRFNRMYKQEYFPIPGPFNFGNELVKVPGLNGSGKMGKSEGEGNAIFLNDAPKALKKKVMRAVTDAGPTEKNSEKIPAVQNLFDLMKIVSAPDTLEHFEGLYNDAAIRYGDFKKQLAEDIELFVAPFRERIAEIEADEAFVRKVVQRGAEKARSNAQKTIKEVREIIGIKPF
jgi:tryptophanyl-tRNA synthetase